MAERDRRSRGRGDQNEARDDFSERVVHIARTAKVVKGGRRFSFRAVVVVGDGKGSVGVGVGKAHEVPEAIRKGSERARREMKRVPLAGTTIPHEVLSRFSAAQVLLKPASPGTGVIAGGGVRAVIEAAGIKDILTKSQGSANILNVVRATIQALGELKDVEVQARNRGRAVEDLLPFWRKQNGRQSSQQSG